MAEGYVETAESAMRASEIIHALQLLMEEFGDLEVVDSYDDPIGDPEEIDGAFVIADKA